jgi:hypothetical protein
LGLPAVRLALNAPGATPFLTGGFARVILKPHLLRGSEDSKPWWQGLRQPCRYRSVFGAAIRIQVSE